MKALLKFTLAALVLAAVPAVVSAADIPLDPGYGTELEITTDYQFPAFDIFNDINFFNMVKLVPIWSSDNKSLAFTSASRLWIVSSDGGNAKMLYEKIYEKNDRSVVMGNPIPIGFSADGKEVIFYDFIYDEARGAVVTITKTGSSFLDGSYDIFAVNIETCELRVIVSNGTLGSLSNDKKYLCYLNWDWKSSKAGTITDHHLVPKIMNLETGESWYLNDDEAFGATIGSRPFITADKSKVICQIYDKTTSKTKLYQIPFKGGSPEPYPFYDGTDIGENVTGGFGGLGMSSDGKWTLYVSQNYTLTVSDAVPEYDKNGNLTGNYSFRHDVTRQCVYNNETGENYYLLPPYPYVTTQEGQFSPDGKKFCYVLRDDYNTEKIYRIFVKDFNANTLQKISTTVTAVDNNVPVQFDTIKNYPNPFNPSTTIEFNIIKQDRVNLSIYNIAGQKICELA